MGPQASEAVEASDYREERALGELDCRVRQDAAGDCRKRSAGAVYAHRRESFPDCRKFRAGTVHKIRCSSSTGTSLSQEGFVKLRENGSRFQGFFQRICLIPMLPGYIGNCQGKPEKRILGTAAGPWPGHGLHIAICHKRLLSNYSLWSILCGGGKCVKKEGAKASRTDAAPSSIVKLSGFSVPAVSGRRTGNR